jgi:hypothetical protein
VPSGAAVQPAGIVREMPARAAEITEVPTGPTIAARLRAQRSPLVDDAMPDVHARLVALRNRMAAAGRPSGL